MILPLSHRWEPWLLYSGVSIHGATSLVAERWATDIIDQILQSPTGPNIILALSASFVQFLQKLTLLCCSIYGTSRGQLPTRCGAVCSKVFQDLGLVFALCTDCAALYIVKCEVSNKSCIGSVWGEAQIYKVPYLWSGGKTKTTRGVWP